MRKQYVRLAITIVLAGLGLMLWLACGGGGDNNSGGGGGGGGGGTIVLAPGFTPDPMTRTGTAGGAFEARTRNASCNGYVSLIAQHTIQLSQPIPTLRISATSTEDTTLMVQMGDGSYRCNDDANGHDPAVEGAFPAGIHRVFVGTFRQNANAAYTLSITSHAGPGGAVPSGGPPAVIPSVGTTTLSLTPGFMPDPHVEHGQAGGAINANTFNASCRGYVGAQPNHIVTLGGNFPNLRVIVSSTEDTTLVVRGPDGAYRCSDDDEGFNPIVAGNMPAGAYTVWVGTYRANTNAAYTIGFTELASTRAANLQ